jgi:hypothetical protein
MFCIFHKSPFVTVNTVLLWRFIKCLRANMKPQQTYIPLTFKSIVIWFPVNRHPPITVAAPSKAWNIFARSNSGIVDSNPNQGMDVCIYSVFVCRQRPCDRLIIRLKSPTNCLKLRNWSEMKRFTDALCCKWEQREDRLNWIRLDGQMTDNHPSAVWARDLIQLIFEYNSETAYFTKSSFPWFVQRCL